MERHEALIQFGMNLGYFQTEGGICHGITLAWLEACFLQEESRFNQRVAHIRNIVSTQQFPQFLCQLDAVHDKVRQHQAINLDEHNILDIVAFIEKISLYQDPMVYEALFGKKLRQTDCEQVSAFASSDKILKNGGLVVLKPHLDVYNQASFARYLQGVASAATQSTSYSSVGILLSTSTHTMALVYQPSQRTGSRNWPFFKAKEAAWCFMDINVSQTYVVSVDASDVIKHISSAYCKNSETVVLNNVVVAFSSVNNQSKLHKQLHVHHDFSSTIPTPKQSAELTNLALTSGNTAILDDLCHEVIIQELKQYSHRDREISSATLIHLLEQQVAVEPILFSASKVNYPEVIDACERLNLRWKQGFDQYVDNPLFVAAHLGHVDMIRTFHHYNISLSYLNRDRENIAHIALKERHVELVAFLAEHAPGLFKQNNLDDENGIQIAMESKASVEVWELLIQHNIITLDDLARLSAKMGGVYLIPFLQNQGLDLNAPTQRGKTLEQIAKFYRQDWFLTSLKEAIALNASLSEANNQVNSDEEAMLRKAEPESEEVRSEVSHYKSYC